MKVYKNRNIFYSQLYQNGQKLQILAFEKLEQVIGAGGGNYSTTGHIHLIWRHLHCTWTLLIDVTLEDINVAFGIAKQEE